MYCCSDRIFMTTDTTTSSSMEKALSSKSAATTATADDENHPQDDKPCTETALEQELEAERVVFDSLFSMRTPKDGWAGLSSGLKSVTKGLAGGVATLVTAPVLGAQQDGAKGFVSGLAMGVAGAVALPVTGVCVGVYQAGRGIWNSGAAIQSANKGMIWNETDRVWEFYTLEHEMQQIEAEELKQQASGATASANGSLSSDRKVADRTYYDLLQVSTNANNVQLKKAYYKQSRLCHPDRNAGKSPSDMEASNKQFQELSHAYQILSNEQSRAYYDNHGLLTDEAAQEMKFHEIDPKIFFAVMFGSEAVRPYIGELWIANKADMLMKEEFFKANMSSKDGSNSEGDNKQQDVDVAQHYENALKRTAQEGIRQRRRIVECATYLRKRIEPFTSGNVDEAEFICMCQEEAAIITKGTFGDVFATAIGFALEVEGADFVGSMTSFLGMESQAAKWKKKSQAWSNQMKIFSSGIGAARAGAKAYSELGQAQKRHLKGHESLELNSTKPAAAAADNDADMDEATVEKVTQQFEQSLPVFLDLAWAINVQDISQTLNKVCYKLFRDHAETLDLETRLRRAEAVKILGREFYSMGVASKKTNFKNVSAQDLRARAEVAAMTTMAKAQGQDISDTDAEEMIRQAKAMEAQRQEHQT